MFSPYTHNTILKIVNQYLLDEQYVKLSDNNIEINNQVVYNLDMRRLI